MIPTACWRSSLGSANGSSRGGRDAVGNIGLAEVIPGGGGREVAGRTTAKGLALLGTARGRGLLRPNACSKSESETGIPKAIVGWVSVLCIGRYGGAVNLKKKVTQPGSCVSGCTSMCLRGADRRGDQEVLQELLKVIL